VRADTVILGGGVIGCAIALRLAQRGQAVLVVERGPVGGEASSAAAGILAPLAEADAPGPLFELLRRSRALYPALAEELRATVGLDIGYRQEGTLVVADSDEELTHLQDRLRWQRAAGLPVAALDPAELRALEPALAPARAALRFADDHQVDNRLLVRALEVACARAGVRFVTAGARRLLSDGGRAAGVELDQGRLSAGSVVVALGSWSGLIEGVPELAQPVRPLRGQLLELRLPAPPFAHVVFGAGGYLVPRGDGRVLVGSTAEWVGFRKEVTAEGLATLLARAIRLCPALAEAPVASFWSGLRPTTADRLPLLGPGPLPGLFFATGHHRNGILLAPITGELIAACVSGAPPALDLAPFSPMRR
jgi:glycine oxidase